MPITTPQSIKIDAPYSVDPKTGTAYNEDGTVYKKAEQTPTETTIMIFKAIISLYPQRLK